MELSWEPRAFLFKKFMTDEECDSIIKMVSYCSPPPCYSCFAAFCRVNCNYYDSMLIGLACLTAVIVNPYGHSGMVKVDSSSRSHKLYPPA